MRKGEWWPRRLRTTPLLLLVIGCMGCVAPLVWAPAGLAQVSSADKVGVAASPLRVRPDVPVTPMNQGVGVANNSPALAIDPTQSAFVLMANRLDAPDFGCALQASGDGGRSWLTATPVSKLPPGAEKCYAPEVAFDRKGTLYYLFVGLEGRGNQPMGAFLTTSRDRAQTFSPPRQVLGPTRFGVRLAIDSSSGSAGRIHLAWLEATSDPPLGGFGPPPNPIKTAHSDDGGITFSEPIQVSDPARPRVVAPALALGPDGAVHVAYYDLGEDARDYQGLEGPTWEGTWSIVLASSWDGGRRFDAGVVVDDAIEPHERSMLIFTMPPPALVADPKGGVCAAWTDARHGDADALLRCSTNDEGRLRWDVPRRLNDDPMGNGRSQYLPRLSVSPEGRLDAIFLDRRIDQYNILTDTLYTSSSDGGRHLTANVKLSSEPSDSRIGQQYVNVAAKGRFEYGSRLAVVSQRTSALVAWPDTRNSKLRTTGQDLFATRVDLPQQPSGRGRMLLLIGGVLGGALLLVVALGVRARRRGGSAAALEGPNAGGGS